MTQVDPQIEPLTEQAPEAKIAAPNVVVLGLQLMLRNWPVLIWVYVIQLGFSLLSGVPVSRALAPYLDHSLAAQRIAGTPDINTVLELWTHVQDAGLVPLATHAAAWVTAMELLLLFIFSTGAIVVYVSADSPRFPVLLRNGIAYFWLFARAAVAAACVSGVILGILFALRSLLLNYASANYVDRKLFLYTTISGAIVLVAGLLLRLWWDLVEVYVVRNDIDGEERVRHALLPAARLLRDHFVRTAGSFFLIGMIGVVALGLCLLLWRVLPARQVWFAGLFAQIGLFLLLASRFWQRGMEAELVLNLDPPRFADDNAEEEEVEEEGEDTLPTLTEPTLRDLVNKLRNEPWAAPEPLVPAPPAPMVGEPNVHNDAKVSAIDRHATKFPLGGPQAAKPGTAEALEPKGLEEKLTEEEGTKQPAEAAKPSQ